MEEALKLVNGEFLELLMWILIPLLLSLFLLTLASSLVQSVFNINDALIGFVLKLSLVIVMSLLFGPQLLQKVKGFSEGVYVHMKEALR